MQYHRRSSKEPTANCANLFVFVPRDMQQHNKGRKTIVANAKVVLFPEKVGFDSLSYENAQTTAW
jgi:hypothetical protein